jgi:hypothetical protein
MLARMCLFTCLLLCGCSYGDQSGRPPGSARSTAPASDWESLPVGIEVIHTPNPVRTPEEPVGEFWPFKWRFRTEVRAIDRPLTVRRFLILGWDGKRFVLDRQQKKFNSGESDGQVFAEWHSCPGGRIAPGNPAVDGSNWAGSYSRKPFKQKWVMIGEDASGKQFKGEAIVELLIE